MLTLEISADGVVIVAGRLDAAQSPAAQQFLDGTSGKVTLECGRLEYVSSAGLGVLLKTQKRLMADGGGLCLTGVNAHIRDILEYSGFDSILEIRASP